MNKNDIWDALISGISSGIGGGDSLALKQSEGVDLSVAVKVALNN
ncbi:hypothetical protein OYT1_ch0963 [Ferriphaselus amnicola]|uniref:Uncharacterized protein n=1 Tax=Ferriphaselus amnicola TaxID=1188319 RepID=A0A2Z6GAS7_9PROT|nr:hypothetical protein [Ferriphaselus amnicola]BBE50524.1 hypothetical protein OYT1_ch0963 [Ferriphaselus amnicola]